MLKEVVDYLVSLGRFSSEPGFVDIPGRPDLAIERVGGGFGRIWESSICQVTGVPTLEGLADWVAAVKSHPRGLPQRAVVHANLEGVQAFVEWVQLSSVRESWVASVQVPMGDGWHFVQRVRQKQDAGEHWSTAELVEGLSLPAFGFLASTREAIERLRSVEWTQTAVSVSSGFGSFQRSEESGSSKVSSVDELPGRVELSFRPSPLLSGFVVMVGVRIESRPEVRAFRVSILGDLFETQTAVANELRTRVQAIFDGLEVMPEGAELPVPAVVVRGSLQFRGTSQDRGPAATQAEGALMARGWLPMRK